MTTRLLKTAAMLVGISAVIHLVLVWMIGLSTDSQEHLFFGVIFLFLAALVWVNKRWAVWLAFFLMMFDGIAAMAGYLSQGAIPEQFVLGIWAADWLAAFCLFISLWRDKNFQAPAAIAKAKRSSERQAPEL